jgi:hypothetical protein
MRQRGSVTQVQHYLEREVRRILHDYYHVDVEKGTPVRYYMDFKSDERLLELREALDRIEHGRFGVCLSCGGPIEIEMLKSSPGVPFCEKCLDAYRDFRVEHGSRASFHHAPQ